VISDPLCDRSRLGWIQLELLLVACLAKHLARQMSDLGYLSWSGRLELCRLAPLHRWSQRQEEPINQSVTGLSNGWRAGRGIVEEKLLVDRYEKRLDISRRDKGATLRYSSLRRRSTELRCLANLARRFALSLGVRMR
jgi:hypothetical protein